ncbi:uncharacterized protein TNCV_3900111 [Trichonephila clavipes]|nr:uncharacterized protein TNCV_3900111 [Trichonephila clavipes]
MLGFGTVADDVPGLTLHLSESNCGEAVKFHLKCPSCKYNYTFNSKKCDSSENYELNTRLVYAMRCIGKGAESARMFCGIMNNHILLQATRETCEHSMAEAVREAVDENDGKRDLAVAVDGSWQKRGFSSKNGLVTVTSVDTGKVIDVEVFSKHCICPNKTKHLQNCKRNFEGYSGKMEVAGALSIFQSLSTMFGKQNI